MKPPIKFFNAVIVLDQKMDHTGSAVSDG